MKRNSILAFCTVVLLTLGLVVGCRATPAPPSNSSVALTVSAAASLQAAIEAIDPMFQRAAQVATRYNFGASGALQQQIEQGAPVDLFISAGVAQMDALERAAAIDPATRQNVLTNQLVLVVPEDSTLDITDFRQLATRPVRRIAVGELRSVPAGQYAQQVLTHLGILEQVRPKLVFASNVRAVLAAVERGDADAGIVYRTDALNADRVKQVATAAEEWHEPIVYPMAVVASSRHPQAARDYGQFLLSKPAQVVFQQFGFGTAE